MLGETSILVNSRELAQRTMAKIVIADKSILASLVHISFLRRFAKFEFERKAQVQTWNSLR